MLRHMNAMHRIGIYGLSGAGKSTLLSNLNSAFEHECQIIEGSENIFSRIDKNQFNSMTELEKYSMREFAISSLEKEYSDKNIIISGHCSLIGQDGEIIPIITDADLNFFTCIIYLDYPTDIIHQRRLNDTRERDHVSELNAWKEFEKSYLLSKCNSQNIKLHTIKHQNTQMIINLINFIINTPQKNLLNASSFFNLNIPNINSYSAFWIIDGDGTLSDQDSGKIFWSESEMQEIKKFFRDGYSFESFKALAFKYQSLNLIEYNTRCEETAFQMKIHPQWIEILKKAAIENIALVVLTSGIREVWENIISNHGLSNHITVIGGNRIEHGFIISSETKSEIVQNIKNLDSKPIVFSFGDRIIDLPMLKTSDYGFIITGSRKSAARITDAHIESSCTDTNKSSLMQLDLNSTSTQNLGIPTTSFPWILAETKKLSDLKQKFRIAQYTTEPIALVLATNTRDSKISGSELRSWHKEIGRFIAGKIINTIGTFQIQIQHVQGEPTIGYQTANESKIGIVVMMRGGEPMALGISKMIPRAFLVHATNAENILDIDLERMTSLILVDSVVNSGKSLFSFIDHINNRCKILKKTIDIHVAVGVTQKQTFDNLLIEFMNLDVQNKINYYTLRVSEKKYTGLGNTDTGHRLYQTTHRE